MVLHWHPLQCSELVVTAGHWKHYCQNSNTNRPWKCYGRVKERPCCIPFHLEREKIDSIMNVMHCRLVHHKTDLFTRSLNYQLVIYNMHACQLYSDLYNVHEFHCATILIYKHVECSFGAISLGQYKYDKRNMAYPIVLIRYSYW